VYCYHIYYFTLLYCFVANRRPLFKYCYDCGRSINVRLTACTRCKEVYFCSKTCKVKAWNARHKDECIRMQGQQLYEYLSMMEYCSHMMFRQNVLLGIYY